MRYKSTERMEQIKSFVETYLLFRTLYAAKIKQNRQIQCYSFLMEKDAERVKIHEEFS